MVANILLGLFGLGIVVFVHELGHFVAARLVGIDVEAFSVGWGKPVLKKTFRGVEYRLGMFPLGGYCKMRGHDDVKGADGDAEAEPEKGSYFGASPIRRIAVCFAGPFFNLVFAAVVFSFVWGFGVEFSDQGNRIVLASDVTGQTYPADEAGLRTGDRIVEVDGRETRLWHEIHRAFARNPGRVMPVTVERDGAIVRLDSHVVPVMDRNTGAGRIGISPWFDTRVMSVVPDSAACRAGLAAGDRVVEVNGRDVRNNVDVILAAAESPRRVTVVFERGGVRQTGVLDVDPSEGILGLVWETGVERTPALSPPAALVRGVRETGRALGDSIHGISLLFRGVNLTQAVSGPLRITHMVGDIATSGFEHRGLAGMLHSAAHFLAFISIALGIMNLLPLPILDGGQIVLYVVEIIRRKPTPPKALRIFQTVGVVLVFGLMIFALFGDIMFLGRAGGG